MKRFIFVLYGIFLLTFVLYSYVFVDPGLFYLHIFFTNFFQTQRSIITAIFIAFIFLGFLLYFLCLYSIKKKILSLKEVMWIIGIAGCVLLFSYPAMVSFDIFNYIATAKVTFLYHENPYILMPIEFTRDPMLLFMHAPNKTALYAPIWIAMTGIPYFLGFGNFLLTLFNFKVFVASFYGVTVWLLWRMTNNLFRTAFFALNPLVLFETFVSSHNDIVMMFLLLLSVTLLEQKSRKWGVITFLLSVGIKYATAILTPLYFLRHLSQRKLFILITLGMYLIFFLSSIREEIYPWYAVWFLLPATFVLDNTLFSWVTVTFSFSLLLRYIPFMLLGTYFGPSPILKLMLMFLPVIASIFLYFLTQKDKRLI